MQDIKGDLIFAVREGNLERVRELISSFFGLSHSPVWSEESYVLLCEALKTKHTEVAKLLLACGSEVDNKSKEPSDTPLHFAVMNGDLEMIKLILDKGANKESKNEFGRTPLYHAIIENKKTEVTEFLLKHKAGVNASDKYGNSPLHVAVQIGCLQIIEHLLNYGANINCVCTSNLICKWTNGYAPLHLAVENGSKEVVALLLSRGANVDVEGEDGITPLHIAVKKAHLSIVEEILNFCPDINNRSNRSSLEIAVQGIRNRYKKIVEVLLEYGFVVNSENADNPRLLHDAVKKGYLKIIEDLLKYGADVNMLCQAYRGQTPLHIAVKYKQEEVAKLLISYEADINARDKTGKTPIFCAIEKADSKITKLLLTNGAYIKDSPELLNTAVNKSIDIVEALLQHDADVNAIDKFGLTALHYTALNVTFQCLKSNNIRVEIAKLLLTKGANPDAQTKNGKTTLHFAVEESLQRVIETLLKFGADVNFRDKYGKPALHIASEKGSSEDVETLLKYGSDINITPRRNSTALGFTITRIYYRSIFKMTAESLKRHIVKIKAANLYVSEENLLSLHQSYKIYLGKFERECEVEIASMKNEKINNTKISFYDLLTKDTISLKKYMRNENIVQVLKSEDYKTKFPIYASMIESPFRKAMERRELLEQSYNISHVLVNNFPELPYDCTEKIFSYLSNKDLLIFMDAARNAKTLHSII